MSLQGSIPLPVTTSDVWTVAAEDGMEKVEPAVPEYSTGAAARRARDRWREDLETRHNHCKYPALRRLLPPVLLPGFQLE